MNATDREKIRKAIRNIVKDMIPMAFAWATVGSVDEDKLTAVCKDVVSGLEYYDVVLSLGSIVPIPSDNTNVLLGLTSPKGEASFIMWSRSIKKYLIALENGFKMQFNDDGTMTMNGDGNGGILISKNTADRLNKIEDDINTLKQVFTTWAPVANDGGAALKAATASWSSQQLQDTKASDLENTKIKHGS